MVLEDRIDAQLLDRHLNPAARTGLGRLWDGPGTIQLTDVLVPATDGPGGPGGPDVPVRVFRPMAADVPAPVVLFVHGGGFTAGELEQFDAQCEWYAHAAAAVTVSVGYRLAPQHPYPAALRDVRAVWRWLHNADGLRRGDVAAELGIDPARSAIVDSSAGAAIAAGLALYLRDHHEPLPALLLLHAPVLDDRHTTPSSHAITDPRTWNRSGSQRSWASYLGPAAAPGADVPPLRRTGPRREPRRPAADLPDFGRSRTRPGRGAGLREPAGSGRCARETSPVPGRHARLRRGRTRGRRQPGVPARPDRGPGPRAASRPVRPTSLSAGVPRTSRCVASA